MSYNTKDLLLLSVCIHAHEESDEKLEKFFFLTNLVAHVMGSTNRQHHNNP